MVFRSLKQLDEGFLLDGRGLVNWPEMPADPSGDASRTPNGSWCHSSVGTDVGQVVMAWLPLLVPALAPRTKCSVRKWSVSGAVSSSVLFLMFFVTCTDLQADECSRRFFCRQVLAAMGLIPEPIPAG